MDLLTGSPAALDAALVERVRDAKAADPLAPVVVIVAGVLQRPYLQRLLARELGAHANVRVRTFGELAQECGEIALVVAGRKPLPSLGDRALAEHLAAEVADDDYFAAVRETDGFADALQRLVRELRGAGVGAAEFARGIHAAGGERRKYGALASLYGRYERAREPFYGVEEALAAVSSERLGGAAVIVYGPWQLTALQREALERLTSGPLSVLVASAGEEPDGVHDELRTWALGRGAAAQAVEAPAAPGALGHLQAALFGEPSPAPPDETVQIVSAPDPAREVRAAARACLRWAREGIQFADMAVAFRSDDPYRALVESVFREAEIPVYLHGGSPLAERPLGRRVLALLELAGSNLPRREVMAFLADARLPDATFGRFGGPSVASWDALSRRAGVVAGAAEWDARLAALEASTTARIEGDEDAPEWLARRRDSIASLRRFIAELAGRLNAAPARATWSEHLAWLRRLVDTYVADGEQAVGGLAALAELDAVTGPVSLERFRAAAARAIARMSVADVEAGRAGAFQLRGVTVLDVNNLRHLRFDAVCVLGLAERQFPPPPRQDALLLDEERARANAATGWQLPLRALGSDPEPLQFALACHAARRRLSLSYARTAGAEVRPALPSGFLRRAAAALTGAPVGAEEFDRLPGWMYERIGAGTIGAPAPADALTPRERERTLLEQRPALGAALIERRHPAFARALGAHAARWDTRELTPFDGVFAAPLGRRPLDRPLSPTSLERFAECPYRYFLGSILRLRAVEEPEAVRSIDALTKGSLVHKVLERFLGEAADDSQLTTARLDAVLDEELAATEALGVTGFPLLWTAAKRELREDLHLWLKLEAEERPALAGWEAAYEARFGARHPDEDERGFPSRDEPVEIRAGERTLSFHGRIDRLEWDPATGRFRLLDYKTGGAWKDKDDALLGGTALQLPIYMHAAAQLLAAGGVDAAPERGSAEYFYVSRRGDFKRVRFSGEALAARREEFESLLAGFADRIERGDFHARPGRACAFCDFAVVCDARKETIFKRKSGAPEIVAHDALKEIA